MKRMVTISYMFLLVFFLLSNILLGQDSTKINKEENTKVDSEEHGNNFVDNDGDGYNDDAPDHDRDGIPNGLDEDYIKLKKNRSQKYVDLDGDGINDNLMIQNRNKQQINRYKNGDMNLKSQDGSNKDGEGPKGKERLNDRGGN
ncbi:MAG: hypothetical protein ABFS12_13335 [Bacteroidota bacterium]